MRRRDERFKDQAKYKARPDPLHDKAQPKRAAGHDRFTLRGQKKVDTQWKLFCLVHNIEKLAHHGYAQ